MDAVTLHAANVARWRSKASRDAVAAGASVDDFTDIDAWTVTGGATFVADVGATAKISTAAGASAFITRDLFISTRGKFLSFWAKPLDANFNKFSVYLACNQRSMSGQRFAGRVQDKGLMAEGVWKHVTIPMSALVADSGSPLPTAADLANVQAIQIEFAPNSGTVAQCLIADLRIHDDPWPNGGVVWYFDDGRLDTYTNVWPLFAAKGWLGSVPVTTARLGGTTSGTDYMTIAQVQEMHTAGWDIPCHSKTHLDFSVVSTASQLTEMRDSYNYLAGNGIRRGLDHFVYPAGGWNTGALTEVLRRFASARSYDSVVKFETPVVNDRGLMRVDKVTTANSAQYKNDMDRVAARGGLVLLSAHSVVPTITDATTQITTSELADLLDYQQSLNLPALRPSDCWKLRGA